MQRLCLLCACCVCLSVDLHTHPNNHFPRHFVDHMRSMEMYACLALCHTPGGMGELSLWRCCPRGKPLRAGGYCSRVPFKETQCTLGNPNVWQH